MDVDRNSEPADDDHRGQFRFPSGGELTEPTGDEGHEASEDAPEEVEEDFGPSRQAVGAVTNFERNLRDQFESGLTMLMQDFENLRKAVQSKEKGYIVIEIDHDQIEEYLNAVE